jgi:hypothetical protein
VVPESAIPSVPQKEERSDVGEEIQAAGRAASDYYRKKPNRKNFDIPASPAEVAPPQGSFEGLFTPPSHG